MVAVPFPQAATRGRGAARITVPLLIELNDEGLGQEIDRQKIDCGRLKQAARLVLAAAGIETGELSIAVVNDQRMQELNRRYLAHDYPTDVLSFLLDGDAAQQSLEGQIIVSWDYAQREAVQYGWSAEDELLLYVVHGCLHLVGHDDSTPETRRQMRQAEDRWLTRFGLKHRFLD